MALKDRIKSNHILAFSIGLVYLWFGALKYFPGQSPAESLAQNTIDALTFHLIPSNISIILLAIWETLVGFLMILNMYRKKIVLIALVHMIFTFSPIFIFPDQIFTNAPFQFTLLGQYIFKNLIIIGGLLTLYKMSKPTPKAV